MKKILVLLAASLLAAIVGPVLAREFDKDGVMQSDTCSDAKGNHYTYQAWSGKVGTPCNWHIGNIDYTGVFGPGAQPASAPAAGAHPAQPK